MKNKGILEPKSETGFNEFKPGLEQGWHEKKPSPKLTNKTHLKKPTCKWDFLGFIGFFK